MDGGRGYTRDGEAYAIAFHALELGDRRRLGHVDADRRECDSEDKGKTDVEGK